MKYLIDLLGVDESTSVIYNTSVHSLETLDGNIVKELEEFVPAPPEQKKRFTISLGFSCNYTCSYCMQSHEKLKKVDEDYLGKLYDKLDSLNLEEYRLEFWGGEPLLYKDTIFRIIERYSKTAGGLYIITNGSLLTEDLVDLLISHDVVISVSHDSIAQKDKRGTDPLDKNTAIKYLFNTYPNNCSLNSVLTETNFNSKERNAFFFDKLGTDNIAFSGEGPVEDYSEDGSIVTADNIDELVYEDIVNGDGLTNAYYMGKIENLLRSMKKGTPIGNLKTSCGIHDQEKYNIFSLEGRELSCHNFTHNFKPITIQERPDCLKCPVVHICKSGCPAIASGTKTFESNCSRSFKVSMSLLRAGIQLLFKTKYVVTNITELK